jgi:hypothetical protein
MYAVCNSTRYHFFYRSEIVATTTAVILYTMFIHGGLTIKMCEWLGIETGVDDQLVVGAMSKVTSSAVVNWEHKYVYPLVIRGYNDPEFDDKYKPKTDGKCAEVCIHVFSRTVQCSAVLNSIV